MAITKLKNTQIHALLNDAYKQMTGKEELTEQELTNFSEAGVEDYATKRSTFTGKLLAQIAKLWYTDSSVRSSYRDIWYQDADKFGAIVEAISIEVPEVKDNSAWRTFATGQTIGTYQLALPIIHNRIYSASSSWSLPISVQNEQLMSAFRGMAELEEFTGKLFMVVDNAIVKHLKNLNSMNRNAYMARKIAYANSEDATGIHVVNLVEKFVADTGAEATGMTVQQFMRSADALRFASEQISLYIGYIQEQTALFNTGGLVKFVPKERLAVQMLDAFVKRVESVALSSTFHDNLVALPLYDPVGAWQNMESLDFDNISSISVKVDGTTIEKAGVIALVSDVYAVCHTIKHERVASQYFDIEGLSHNEFQHHDMYFNNLDQNGIVFVLDDVLPVQA